MHTGRHQQSCCYHSSVPLFYQANHRHDKEKQFQRPCRPPGSCCGLASVHAQAITGLSFALSTANCSFQPLQSPKVGGKAAPLHWTNNERREAVLQAGVSYGGTDRIPGVAEPRSLTKYLAGAALARSISSRNCLDGFSSATKCRALLASRGWW